MFGEIKFFVGLKVNQMKHENFITQSKYGGLIFFGMEDSKYIIIALEMRMSHPSSIDLYRQSVYFMRFKMFGRLLSKSENYASFRLLNGWSIYIWTRCKRFKNH